jgi:3-isopropylmalate dehydrogenase
MNANGYRVLVLPGDGIGTEVIREARRVLERMAGRHGLSLEITEDWIGGACYDRHGSFLRDQTLVAALASDAVLVGAEGGPKWDDLKLPGTPEERSGLSRLRRAMDVFANMRPVKAHSALLAVSPFKPEVAAGVDLVIVRELTGGIYFGAPRGIEERADGTRRGVDTQVYTSPEVQRVARSALALARTRRSVVCSIDKANVMESGQMWREEVQHVRDREFPDVRLSHMYADACAMQLVRDPRQFDVILADNLFGDFLSDGAAMIAGSLGMLPSASLGVPAGHGRARALYEPVHGSAPDIAGRNAANPLGAILSVAMMLRHTFGRDDLARSVDDAVEAVLAQGVRTTDIAEPSTATVGTSEMGDAVLSELSRAA